MSLLSATEEKEQNYLEEEEEDEEMMTRAALSSEEEEENDDGDGAQGSSMNDLLMCGGAGSATQPGGSTSSSAKRAKPEYQILEQKDLREELDGLAIEVSAVTGLRPAQCQTLLRHFKWSKMVFCERYYEAPELEQGRLLAQAGVSIRSPPRKTAKRAICQICFGRSSLLGLNCAHLFCPQCWTEYLAQKVLNEGQVEISCAADKCSVAVDEDFALPRLQAKGEQAQMVYRRLLLNSFVEHNPVIKWCPAPNCEKAVKVQVAEPMKVKCPCGHIFCFQCLEMWHAPVSCALLRVWLRQCCDDSGTFQWLNAYTKDCPNCKTAIEKNGGCNHMTCRAMACKFEFCWVCMGDWKSHNANYSCNRFADNQEQKSRERKAEDARSALKRYLHYYDRYRNHENSMALEHKLYKQVRERMEQFQRAKFSYIETIFLVQAVDALCECRRTLMYTYAFAFYLAQENVQTKIFEDNQQDLEIATEQLSEYLEQDLEQEKELAHMKIKVLDKTRYVESRRMKILQHCVEGNERGEWRYNHELGNKLGPADGGTLRCIY